MTYSTTKYQLTHLLQDAWKRMGQLSTWIVTGGSATSVINTAWAGVEDQIFDDNDPALLYGSVVVIDASAVAPEGKIGRITAYDSSSQTITMDTLTQAVSAGQRIGIASPLFPFEDMRDLANIALRKMGKIELVDTSLTSIAGQTEYTMPIRVRPKRVRIQTVKSTNNNYWKTISGWSVIPATSGTAWKLVLPPLTAGFSIELLYEDLHPELSAYDSDILENIEPERILDALIAEAFQWYNNQINGSNAYFLQRENKALQDLAQAEVKFPTAKTIKQIQGLPHWGLRGEYVPGTSDLKE